MQPLEAGAHLPVGVGAGRVVEVGDEVIDADVATRLAMAAETLPR